MEQFILLIDTSTAVCSVSLACGSNIVASRQSDDFHCHSSKLAPFIDSCLHEAGIEACKLSGVVISKGPGSYTGLRVGTSTAKGLCYGAGIPLYSCNSLQMTACCAIDALGCNLDKTALIVPMIDARRMEVYTAVYDAQANEIEKTQAKIIDNTSFANILENRKVYFVGDGAAKCKGIIESENAFFLEVKANASGMLRPALKAIEKGEKEDIAYFTPLYLKDFVATKSKKSQF